MNFILPKGKNRKQKLHDFAEQLIQLSEQIGFKISARGWCYILENPPYRLITKAEFDLVENAINECRKKGILAVDFTAEEEGRKFSGVETPNKETPVKYMRRFLDATLNAGDLYTPDWWKGEEYYIQMLVEKIDLKTLFEPICRRFKIPIATSKGWSSIIQRGEYARRFQEAEENGLQCVLLYCGDHDPDGLRISDFLRRNLEELVDIKWNDGTDGYDPSELIIKRFGLDYDFIIKNKLSWINNLITGSKGYIATIVNGKIVQGKTKNGKPHPNFNMEYAQDYLKKYGVRKCEANTLVTRPNEGRKLCLETILSYLGEDAEDRFQDKRNRVLATVDDFMKKTGMDRPIKEAIKLIEQED